MNDFYNFYVYNYSDGSFSRKLTHIAIDNIVGDWKQSRDTFRARGLCEVVIFTPQEVSQGVDFFD